MDAGFPSRQHGNGKEVARYLAIHAFDGLVVIHSRSEQAKVMARILPQAKVHQFGEFEINQCSDYCASLDNGNEGARCPKKSRSPYGTDAR